ncbi:EI24 domain-containing protein [Shimia ponticola]|uniref:EI24 domain-containing protein n=1 Tax=Shimia ponticola TaxID=2582893 RepID=UPI0011BD4932|nr:EI24 domain-containing protein [Shimia ponticola]
MILRAFFLALGQLNDSRFRGVLFRGIGLTIVLLVAVYAAFLWLIEWAFGEGTTLPLIGEVTWVGDLLSFGSIFVMLLLSIFLMVPVASAITSLFLDEVAEAVEDVHYRDVARPRRVSFWDGLRDTVNFLGVLIGANLAALILYAFFPPAAPFIFLGMNGFLLGREYFQVTAMRHLGRDGAKKMREEFRVTIWIAGCLMAFPLTIPLVNLLVPVIGAATFTHLYHQLRQL